MLCFYDHHRRPDSAAVLGPQASRLPPCHHSAWLHRREPQ